MNTLQELEEICKQELPKVARALSDRLSFDCIRGPFVPQPSFDPVNKDTDLLRLALQDLAKKDIVSEAVNILIGGFDGEYDHEKQQTLLKGKYHRKYEMMSYKYPAGAGFTKNGEVHIGQIESLTAFKKSEGVDFMLNYRDQHTWESYDIRFSIAIKSVPARTKDEASLEGTAEILIGKYHGRKVDSDLLSLYVLVPGKKHIHWGGPLPEAGKLEEALKYGLTIGHQLAKATTTYRLINGQKTGEVQGAAYQKVDCEEMPQEWINTFQEALVAASPVLTPENPGKAEYEKMKSNIQKELNGQPLSEAEHEAFADVVIRFKKIELCDDRKEQKPHGLTETQKEALSDIITRFKNLELD